MKEELDILIHESGVGEAWAVSKLKSSLYTYIEDLLIKARIDELEKFGNTTDINGKALVYGSLYTVQLERITRLKQQLTKNGDSL